jgi:hypothetical protein
MCMCMSKYSVCVYMCMYVCVFMCESVVWVVRVDGRV